MNTEKEKDQDQDKDLEQDQKDNGIKFIIVDRDTRRRKLDKNFRDEFYTVREKMDIADFHLEEFIKDQQSRSHLSNSLELLCVAKHLCGGATDLSLTSVLLRQNIAPVKGVAIATCCHHQCDLKTFCNIEVLMNEGEFS